MGQVTAVGQARPDGVAGIDARYTALVEEPGAAARCNRRRAAAWRVRWPGLDLVHMLVSHHSGGCLGSLRRTCWREAAALSFHHALAGVVLRRDQLMIFPGFLRYLYRRQQCHIPESGLAC